MDQKQDDFDFSTVSWDVIYKYFSVNKGYQLVKHQIESFNDFVLRKLDQIIEGFNVIEVPHQYIPEKELFKYVLSLEVTNPIINKPIIYEKDGSTKVMTPNDARQRNFTYASSLTVDINIRAKTYNEELDQYVEETKTINGVPLGKIPIMVKSNYCVLKNIHTKNNQECRYDYGGYFLINGNEKVIISQDRISENKTFVFTNNKVSTYSHIAEIRSVQENKLGVPKITTIKLAAKANQFGRYMRINIHHIKTDIPLFILFKALGLETDKSIIEHIVFDINDKTNMILINELTACIEEANAIMCQKDALEYLAKYLNITGYPKEVLYNKNQRINIVRAVLEKEFLPHVGREFEKKRVYLGYMVNKLLKCVLGLKPYDDRDSYINKKVDTPGVLMANLFRQYYGKVIKDMKNMLQKEINSGGWKATGKFINVINKINITKLFKSTIIDSGMRYALATGNWGIKSNKNKQGVAQVLNRMTYNSTLSHLRRINTPIEKSGKLVQPRKLHSTQWGIICPCETPEGSAVGLVKNMSVMTSITICSNSENLKKVLDANGLEKFDATKVAEFFNKTKIFLNGDIIGFHSVPNELYSTLKDMKRTGSINVYTSIVWNVSDNEIVICSEGGRCVRPLFIVNTDHSSLPLENFNVKKEYDWYDMVIGREGGKPVVEFLDVEELNASMIAMKFEDIKKGIKGTLLPVRYTHLEIHPISILGVAAANIPFPDHNQAPRNCYQCLWEEEEVLMSNGEKKAIKDVKVGDDVVSFDPISLQVTHTKVVNQFVKDTEKTIYKIKTISGRNIVATNDHLFMTNKGWVKVEDLKSSNDIKVGVHVGASQYVSNNVDEYLIINEEEFKNTLLSYNISQSKIKKYVDFLSGIEMLPLQSTNMNLPIIARICGFILTDGSLNIYTRNGSMACQCQADFGDITSAEAFENDLEYIGFDKSKITECNSDGYGTTFKVCHGGVLPALLIALGVSFGKKTETPRFPVPNWIMNGSLLVQREFIAGFQGGDGCQIRWNKFKKCGYNFICAETSQQINPKFCDSLTAFYEQLRTIMTRLDIKTNPITTTTVEINRVKVALKIKDTHDNLINYFDRIGYRYDTRKATNSAIVIEYLRYKNILYESHKVKIEKLRELYDQNQSTREIANALNMNIDRVRDYIRSYQNGRVISMKRLKDNTIDKWVNRIESNAFTVFIPIDSIEVVPNCKIADITVDSNNHSFIAGDSFMVHNSSMCKQAIGIYASNYRERFDTLAHVLDYGQKPLVRTKMAKLLNSDNLPNGVNAVVAIMTYTGYNQEDSVILNKSAVDRGMFTSTYYRTYKEQNNKNHSNGEEEFFTKPKNINKNNKPYNYDKIDEDGFVPENTFVEPGDIIIGKCMPNKVDNTIIYKDNSVALKNNEKGFVDRNCYNDKYFTNVNGDGYNFAKIRLRNVRTPITGDKFASRMAQKGTMGISYSQQDMPFTKDGIVPDIIMNPNAIPSRMTIGQLMECIMGKACAIKGTYGDCTPFTDLSVEEIASVLEGHGLEKYGNEVMYDPRSGNQIHCDIFIGPTFYQRLKHMTADKTHSRSASGPIVLLTRQPADGRSREGGLRLGEMEVEVHWAHGINQFLKERMMECSDNYRIHVCKQCGFQAIANPEKNLFMCKNCKNVTNFSEIRIPYSAKLLFQEIGTMSVGVKFIT